MIRRLLGRRRAGRAYGHLADALGNTQKESPYARVLPVATTREPTPAASEAQLRQQLLSTIARMQIAQMAERAAHRSQIARRDARIEALIAQREQQRC